MSSDVVLTSALRTNLQSLQNTQRLIDETQLKLATGLKVNSALDNPQNFFAAQNLDNRAGDLNRLLDGIGQSVRTIEQADNGIESLTKLVEQAESIATSALEATSSAAEGTSVAGNVDLTNFEAAATYDDAEITFTATNAQGQEFALTNATIALATDDTEQTIINGINAITDADGNQVFNASLSDSGRLQIETNDQAINFNIEINGDTSDAASRTADSQALAAELGLGQQTQLTDPTATASTVAVTSKSASTVTSAALYQSDGETTATRSTTLQSLLRDRETASGAINDDVFTVTEGTTGEGDSFAIEVGVNGGARQQIAVSATTTVQGLVDSINNDSVLKTQIKASFDESTGQIGLTSLTSDVESIEIGAFVSDTQADDGSGVTADAGSSLAIDFGFGVGSAVTASADAIDNDDSTDDVLTDTSTIQSIRVSGGAGEVAQFESDFNTVREQIDTLVKDSDYRGVNLLNGDDLTTTFDEDRTNTLKTEGVDFTSTGLGIDGASFNNRSSIDDSLNQARDALNSVRNFGQSIANDLAIIQTRRDFTESTVNTLEAGADDLTVADQNEEGANLLALQTRQQLGVTSLSLASQSQQAVLRLF